ncbi:glycosyltransferase [Chryseobacterium sp.]|uniref:glycosyltransferase n=1 Tax=Chryseobacterium sp. TaxID=1871047 RepID=UPI00388E989E
MTPLVSILCLCYNQATFIRESLDSIKKQLYTNYEILICDDFSKDNSVEIIEQWISENPTLPITFVKHEENKGICKSLNELLSLSRGKYIQLLALDDLLEEDKLQRHVSLLERSKETEALVFSEAHLIDDYSKRYQNKFIAYHHQYLSLESRNYYHDILMKNFIPAMSTLLKSSIIKEMGGWDETLSYEDYDMWLGLSRDFDFIFDDKPSCSYRLHASNTHKKKNFTEDSNFDIFIKHKEHPIAKQRLFSIVKDKYFKRTLKNEHIRYYSIYKDYPSEQYCIKKNISPMTYKIWASVKQVLGK